MTGAEEVGRGNRNSPGSRDCIPGHSCGRQEKLADTFWEEGNDKRQ